VTHFRWNSEEYAFCGLQSQAFTVKQFFSFMAKQKGRDTQVHELVFPDLSYSELEEWISNTIVVSKNSH
jgi:hypothetical protein